MLSFDFVATAWLAAAAGALVPPLLVLVAEWTFKPLSDWFSSTSSCDSEPLSSTPLSHG